MYGMSRKRCAIVSSTMASLLRRRQRFCSPLLLRVVDASRHGQDRDAAIGYSTRNRLLFVVHVVIEDETIRIISAWNATAPEHEIYDS